MSSIDFKPRSQIALEDLKDLWEVENPDWLKQRKADWQHIQRYNLRKEVTAKEKKELRKYFVLGEIDQYVSVIPRFILAPITTPDIAQRVFDSELVAEDRWRVVLSYFNAITRYGEGASWQSQHVQSVVCGVLSRGFEQLITNSGSPDASKPYAAASIYVWTFYAQISNRIFDYGSSYHASIEGLDFLISCFPYANEEDMRESVDFEDLCEFAQEVIDDGDSSEFAIQFAKRLLGKKTELLTAWHNSK